MNDITLEREFYCNTEIHIQVQIFYVFGLFLISLIQAFRGRSLPTNYNETKFIIYATLLTNLCFLIMFPLYYSQQRQIDKASINLLLLILSNLSFITFTHLNKVYIIVFRPDLNKPEVFRENMLKNIRKKAKNVVPG